MSREKKYPHGFMRLDFLIPISMVERFNEFCDKFHLSKTDALHIALNYCFMSEAERETTLKQVEFQNEMLRKQNADLLEEVQALKGVVKKEHLPLPKFNHIQENVSVMRKEWLNNNLDEVRSIVASSKMDIFEAMVELRKRSGMRLSVQEVKEVLV